MLRSSGIIRTFTTFLNGSFRSNIDQYNNIKNAISKFSSEININKNYSFMTSNSVRMVWNSDNLKKFGRPLHDFLTTLKSNDTNTFNKDIVKYLSESKKKYTIVEPTDYELKNNKNHWHDFIINNVIKEINMNCYNVPMMNILQDKYNALHMNFKINKNLELDSFKNHYVEISQYGEQLKFDIHKQNNIDFQNIEKETYLFGFNMSSSSNISNINVESVEQFVDFLESEVYALVTKKSNEIETIIMH